MQLRRISTIVVVATIIFIVAAFFALVWVPKWQVAALLNVKGVNTEDVFKAENDARATLAQTIAILVQILGGAAVLIGLYVAWRNLAATADNLKLANQNLEPTKEATAKNLEVANQNLELSKRGQVAEHFTKAIEQLAATDDKGEPKLELRLAGIHALEQIAQDSENDHWPIMEILTAHLRKNAQWKERNLATADTQETRRLLASGISSANSEHAPASERNLATDTQVIIQAIVMVIRRRNWNHEKFEQRLDLRRVDLHGAHLEHGHLYRTHLEGAHLEHAYLTGTYLIGAELARAQLNGAHLDDAKLHHTRMSGALGLTQHQVDSAEGNPWTGLPEGIDMPKSWNDVPPGFPG